MTDSNAIELRTTLCAILTEFEDAAMAIRVEASDTQAREEVWRNAIGDLAREYATEIEGMFTPEQAAMLGAGECEVVMSSTDGLCTDDPKHWFKLSCGHSFTIDGLEKPVVCAVCWKAVER